MKKLNFCIAGRKRGGFETKKLADYVCVCDKRTSLSLPKHGTYRTPFHMAFRVGELAVKGKS